MAFATEHDVPIPYMQRTRDYYLKLGYPGYRWAHFVDVPFTPLQASLSRARVALITTAAPYQPDAGLYKQACSTGRKVREIFTKAAGGV